MPKEKHSGREREHKRKSCRMTENNNGLSEQEIEMLNRALLCVIPEWSKVSSVLTSAVNGRMKFVRDGAENALNRPNSLSADKTTSDRDVETRILSSAGNRMDLANEASLVPCPIFNISHSTDQMPGSGISSSNHKKAISSQNTTSEERTTVRLQTTKSPQILGSFEVPHQNFFSFEDKGSREFSDSHLQSNEEHAPSLFSPGFDRLVSDPEISASSSVSGSCWINPAQYPSWDKINRSNLPLSPLIRRMDIPDEMPRRFDTNDLLPDSNGDKRRTSKEGGMESSAQKDSTLAKAGLLNTNPINEIPDVVQSKSISREENCSTEDVSVEPISTKNGEELIEHLDQQQQQSVVGDFLQKSCPLVSACNVEAMEVDQRSSQCSFLSPIDDDVVRSADENLQIPPEKTTADLHVQSNSDKNIGCFVAVPCEKTVSEGLRTSKNSLLTASGYKAQAAVVSSNSQSLETTFSPHKPISSRGLSGASAVQRYMEASLQFLGGARSPGNNSLLPNTQVNFLGNNRYSLPEEDARLRSESVNVSALFPKGRNLRRTFTSPKNHRKLNNSQGSPMLSATDDFLGCEEFSKPVVRERLSSEAEGGSFDSGVDALFRKPRTRQKSPNNRKRKLFFSPDQLQLKHFDDRPEKKFRSDSSASVDRVALKKDDSFFECSPASGDDARLLRCSDSNCEATGLCSDNIFSQLIQHDKIITKYDERVEIYGNTIRGICQKRNDCKRVTDVEVSPKENEDSNKDESRIDSAAGLCEKQLREEKDLNLAGEIRNSSLICPSLIKSKMPLKDKSPPHLIDLKECQVKQQAGGGNAEKVLLSKRNFSLAYKSHILKTPAAAAFLLHQNSELHGKSDQLNHQKQKSSLSLTAKGSIIEEVEGQGNNLNSDRLRSESRMRGSKPIASSLTSTGRFISSCDETLNADFNASGSSLSSSSEYEVILLSDCDTDLPVKQNHKRHKLKANAGICSQHTESGIVKNKTSNKLYYKQSSDSEFVNRLERCNASSSDDVSLSSVARHQHKRSERKATVSLGLRSTAFSPPSHKSNSSSVQLCDALKKKTKAQEKSPSDSCSKTPLREKTASNRLFCNDYVHVKKTKERLKREVDSSGKVKDVCLREDK